MISNIRLQHFRSYDDESFEFRDGVNIIVGPNASGKTNLLEAVLVIARSGSYRVSDSELIMHHQPWARLDAMVGDELRTLKLMAGPPPEKRYEISGHTYTRLSLDKTLPIVLFEPNHLLLLTGSPDKRRDYLDDLLQQTTPGYATLLRHYRRALAQRNALLRDGRASNDHIFPWNVRLSELGARIVRARHELTRQFAAELPSLYLELSRTETRAMIDYHTGAVPDQYETHMLRELERRLDSDIARGFTSFGPHRDDLTVWFNDSPAAEVASRGELRTLVLGLKILELKLLEKLRGTPPLLLLDDVFSELDGARRQALTTHLKDYQTFITTTDADIIAHHFAEHSNVILIGTNT